MEDILTDWEDRINFLSDHIEELESQLQYYQNLVAEKDSLINNLIQENNSLKSQGIVIEKPISIPTEPPQITIPSPNLHPPPDVGISPELNSINTEISIVPSVPIENTVNFDSEIRKRQCPKCGAQGFSIREVEDKTQVLCFFPRVYAKKRVCVKCRNEF